MSKDEANLRRVEGTREMHSISVHGRETDNLWSRLCVRLVRFPDALSTGDVYPLQRGSSLDSLSPLLLPHDSHFLLLSVSLSLSLLFLFCVASFLSFRLFLSFQVALAHVTQFQRYMVASGISSAGLTRVATYLPGGNFDFYL